MKVLGINKILEWCHLLLNSGKYACPKKLINGQLYFHLKKEWHKVAKYIYENAEELVGEDRKTFSKPLKK